MSLSSSVPISHPFKSILTGRQDSFELADGTLAFLTTQPDPANPDGGSQLAALYRFTQTGAPVSEFGTSGVVTIAIPGQMSTAPSGMMVDSRGRFVCGGFTKNQDFGAGPSQTFIARVWP